MNTFPSCCGTEHVKQGIWLGPVSLTLQNNKASSGEAAVAVISRARIYQAALGEGHNMSVLDPAANLHSRFQKVRKEPFSILYVVSHSICASLLFVNLTQARVILGERASIENLSIRLIYDRCGRAQTVVVLGYTENKLSRQCGASQ